MVKSLLLKILSAFGIRPRLRHVLQLGYIMEQQAIRFYEHFAEQTGNDTVKKLCAEILDEENRHLQLIEDKLSRWKSLPASQKDLTVLDADAKLRNLFLSPPGHNAPAEEFAAYAMDQEQNMVTFYENYKSEFTHTWKRNRLKKMIDEEKEHVERWSEILSIR